MARQERMINCEMMGEILTLVCYARSLMCCSLSQQCLWWVGHDGLGRDSREQSLTAVTWLRL